MSPISMVHVLRRLRLRQGQMQGFLGLRPRLHSTGPTRSRYQIEYIQDECGS